MPEPMCDPDVVPYEDITRTFVARCGCGWQVEYTDRADAETAAGQHRQEGTR